LDEEAGRVWMKHSTYRGIRGCIGKKDVALWPHFEDAVVAGMEHGRGEERFAAGGGEGSCLGRPLLVVEGKAVIIRNMGMGVGASGD
jgi:hypothetical protein